MENNLENNDFFPAFLSAINGRFDEPHKKKLKITYNFIFRPSQVSVLPKTYS